MKPPVPQAGFCALLGLYQPEIICDIGSLDGHQAIAFKRICPTAQVIAFEANPRNYDAMIANERIHAADIKVENLAVSDETAQVEFNLVEIPGDKPWARGTSSLRERRSPAGGLTATKVAVEATRLDDYLRDSKGRIALWIDVEGAADRVLAGLGGIADRVVVIHLEAEDAPMWEGQLTWPEIEQELTRDFEAVAALRESDTQRNHLLLRHGATGRRSVRALLKLASLPGAGRLWVPRQRSGWRGVLALVFSRAARRFAAIDPV